MRTRNLIHPGEILREEFMKPMGISQNALAIALHVSAIRILGACPRETWNHGRYGFAPWKILWDYI